VSGAFRYALRAGYGDTDQARIVHHGVYVRWLEEARTAWLRDKGLSLAEIEREKRIGFAVHSMQLRYQQPARFEDEIEVEVLVGKLGRASLRFDYRVLREDVTLAEAEVTLACVDLDRMRARGIPDFIRDVCE